MYDYFFGAPGTFRLWFILSVLLIASLWKIFQKADRPGWIALIPVYNIYVLLKIAGKPGWWLLLYLVPVANLIFYIWTLNMVSKSFGKDEGFTVGLFLLGFIFFPILAFGPSRYLGPYGNPVEFQLRQNPAFDFENKS